MVNGMSRNCLKEEEDPGRFELSDEQRERVKDLLPGKASDPERFGESNSVFQRFNRWAKKDVW
jgi:hypothetical protein